MGLMATDICTKYDGKWWLDTGWGCGYIEVRSGKVVDSAPIFRKWLGRWFCSAVFNYKIWRLDAK